MTLLAILCSFRQRDGDERTKRNRQDHLYLEGLYPFANVPTFDPISNTSDWRYKSCEQTHTCPLTLEFYSANEYWVKAGSLMSTYTHLRGLPPSVGGTCAPTGDGDAEPRTGAPGRADGAP
jgi:hypothetical protein